MAVCQNLVPLVNIKIAGKWMFIPLKMVLIDGIDPYPYPNTPSTAWYKPIKSSRAPNWAAAWWSAGPQTSVRWRPRCDWACSPRSTTGAKPGEDGHQHGEISHHSWDITGYIDIYRYRYWYRHRYRYSIQYISIQFYLYWYNYITSLTNYREITWNLSTYKPRTRTALPRSDGGMGMGRSCLESLACRGWKWTCWSCCRWSMIKLKGDKSW